MSSSWALPAETRVQQAGELRRQLLTALDGAVDSFELDGSAVCELDTAGLQLLLATAKEAERRGLRLLLRAASPRLRDTLAVLGVQSRFQFLPPHAC